MKARTSSLASVLSQLRQRSGLSIRDLEVRSGVNRSNISRLERGESSQPSPETLTRLAEALNVDASELLTAAGYTATRAAGLPSFQPYLRAKYGHLPASAQKELTAYLERLEAEYAKPATRRKTKST